MDRLRRGRFGAALLLSAPLVLSGCGNDRLPAELRAAAQSSPSTSTSTTSARSTTSSTIRPTTPTTAAPAIPPDADQLGRVAVRVEEIALVENPVAVLTRPGRAGLYAAERAGRVRLLGAPSGAPALLDITSDVSTDGEGGLLGIAFSPDGGRLFVHYTDRAHDTRIVEYQLTRDGADPGSRRDLLHIDQPAIVHNGGGLVVTDDGLLWIGIGDGGDRGAGRGVAQRLDSLLGKLLRIDPNPSADLPYTIPADNPFAGTAGARGEIWSLGLRNPWRFSFDRATGDLWIGDVGEFAIEEIDLAVAPTRGAGVNFGWPAFEGTRRFQGPAPETPVGPLHEYEHRSGECAVTGGFVYRGSAIPDLAGAYVYGDVCKGGVRALSQRDGGVVAERDLGVTVQQLVSFAEDETGELYAVSLVGQIYRIVPA